jgi:hypothetical protein
MKILQISCNILSGILLFGILFIPVCVNAQKDLKGNNFQKDFNAFKISINQQFDKFIQHNDSVFIQFLEKAWKEFNGVQNMPPVFPKPVPQPGDINPSKSNVRDKSNETKESPKLNNEQLIPVQKDSFPKKLETFDIAPASSSFMFYGSTISIPHQSALLPVLNSLTEEGIIGFFKSATHSSLLNSLTLKIKESSTYCKLNDWGLASMLMTAAQKLYTARNEQVLFTWYALIRNGYNVKVGYNKESIYLLLPATEKVYSASYTIKEIPYYLFDFDQTTQQANPIFIYEADYPGNKPGFSFLITETPQLENEYTTKTIGPNNSLILKINRNLIDFYTNYPMCDLKVFFIAPLSDNIIRQLDLYFNPALENKSDDERVAFLLDYVQRGIRYKTDQEQFGHEMYLFAEETLFYTAADCLDRSILLARLIRRYTKLEAIGLLYPEHVSLAVNIKDVTGGKYFTFKDKRFYNCDPTFIGSLCGEIMPRFKNSVPEFIDYNLQ